MTNTQKILVSTGVQIAAGIIAMRAWKKHPVLGFFGGFFAVGVVAYAMGVGRPSPAPPPDTSMGGSGP